MEILATKYDYLPLQWSKNEIAVIIDAVDVENSDRSGLKYWLEIMKPASYLSGEFVVFRKLCGNESPAVEIGGSFQYNGCVIYIEEYLDAFLEYNLPNETGFTLLPKMVQPYKVKTWAERDGVLVAGSEVESDIEYVLKGGLSKDSFGLYGSSFFTEYLKENHAFLTYQPDWQFLNKKTPQYLSFLTNQAPLPEKLVLRVELYYFSVVGGKLHEPLENTAEIEINDISLISVAVGFEQLGLHDHENAQRIKYYECWLNDEDGKILTQKRRFYIDQNYYEHERAVLLNNSLGSWEVIRFTGDKVEEVTIDRVLGERNLSAGYLPTEAEVFVHRKDGKRSAQLSTGFREDPEWLTVYEELAHAYEVYLQTRHGWVPVVVKASQFLQRKDKEDIGERVFELQHAKDTGGFDLLPYKSPAPARPTVWVPSGPYCLVNSKGLRTGLQGAATLELFYSDVNPLEKVKGVTRKENVPGTEGYVLPTENAACEVGTANYLNVEISRQGNYARNNCPSGEAGEKATIVVSAGIFGGTTQAEADQRAEAEWRRLDTQATANALGSCELTPENYTATVAVDYAHFRWNTMRAAGAYASNYVVQYLAGDGSGNGWFLSSGPNVYGSGTNDIDLPTNYSSSDWRFGFYMKSSGVTTCKIFVNGTEIFSGDSTTMTVSSGQAVVFIPAASIPSQAKVYVKIT